MARMPRLLRRGPVIDEAEFEITRLRTLERLERMRTGSDESTDIDTMSEETGQAPDGDRAFGDEFTAGDAATPAIAVAERMVPATEPAAPGEDDGPALRRDLRARGPITLPDHAVNVMAEPGELDPAPQFTPPDEAAEVLAEPSLAMADDIAEPLVESLVEMPVEPLVEPQGLDPEPASEPVHSNGNGHHAAAAIESETLVLARADERVEPPTKTRQGARRASPDAQAPAARNGSGSPKRGHVAAVRTPAAAPGPAPASCPYCAVLLVPAPEASRRCTRCRQRIIVRRIDGRAVFLTEAAVMVFEAERQRVANTGRWTRDRERWMRLAEAAGAPPGRLRRLAAAPLSDENVAAIRSVYLATVERTFRAAKRERRWQDSARIRRDHAMALYRVAGSPMPPPDDVLALYREAAMADLRGILEFRRLAALVAAKCCDACQADDGRSFRIARELKTPRLPHVGCPRGLCGCRWDLAEHDRSLVARYLRKRAHG